MTQSDACPTGVQVMGLIAAGSGNILYIEFDHEIFSTIILSLPLI